MDISTLGSELKDDKYTTQQNDRAGMIVLQRKAPPPHLDKHQIKKTTALLQDRFLGRQGDSGRASQQKYVHHAQVHS